MEDSLSLLLDTMQTQEQVCSVEYEKRLYVLKELAHAYIQGSTKVVSFLDLSPCTHQKMIKEHEWWITSELQKLRTEDVVLFIHFVYSFKKEQYNKPLLPIKDDGRIAYMRAPLTEELFDLLSEYHPHLFVQYEEDFEHAAEAVQKGTATYCLLPYKTTEGTYVLKTVEYLKQYALTAVSILPVFDEDQITTQYALCGRSFFDPIEEPHMMLYLSGISKKQVCILETLLHFLNTEVDTFHYDRTKGSVTFSCPYIKDFGMLLLYLDMYEISYQFLELDNGEFKDLDNFEGE